MRREEYEAMDDRDEEVNQGTGRATEEQLRGRRIVKAKIQKRRTTEVYCSSDNLHEI